MSHWWREKILLTSQNRIFSLIANELKAILPHPVLTDLLCLCYGVQDTRTRKTALESGETRQVVVRTPTVKVSDGGAKLAMEAEK